MAKQVIPALAALIFISLLILFVVVLEPDRAQDAPGRDFPGAPEFDRIDTNGDRRMTADEWDVFFGGAFTSMDANRDGFVSIDEFGAGRPVSGEKGEALPGPPPEMIFRRMDANGDRKISRLEWTAHHRERFSRMDRNGDGAVTDEETRGMPFPGVKGPPADGKAGGPPL